MSAFEPGGRPAAAPRLARDPADQWHECACGGRHWGLFGAAGLLVSRGDQALLQLRAAKTHHGGAWGLPGGARQQGEKPLAAALREGREEVGLDPAAISPDWWVIVDHGGWSYTTIGAAAPGGDPLTGPANWETSALAWVARDQVAGYNLHHGLAQAWPVLEPLVGRRATLIVDAANVVGSRPDGWWRDRSGAARRLRGELERLARQGLANIWSQAPNGWWPELVMVVEGQARGIGQGEGVKVVDAPGEGDDEIVVQARLAVQAQRGPVLVATADKGLSARLRATGAAVIRPASVRVGL